MSNQTVLIGGLPIRAVDNGDGSYSLATSAPGGGGAGGPATIANGADANAGSTTDAAVTTNATGTLSSKLRGLVAILADVWDSTNHWLKTNGVVQGALVDKSGTIAAGGTAQVLAASNAARRYLLVQNLSTSVLYINTTGTAVVGQPSVALKACTVANDGTGGAYVCEGSFIPTGAVSIIGATTSAAFAAREG